MAAHLNGVQGKSPMVGARIRQADADRLTALAEHFGISPSQVIRVALQRGLVALEREGPGPPDGGQSTTHDDDEGDR
jgi:hypothetical protein